MRSTTVRQRVGYEAGADALNLVRRGFERLAATELGQDGTLGGFAATEVMAFFLVFLM